jgi:hypothetical protein
MNKLNQEEFNELISQSQVKPRLKNELRFITSTENLSDEEWGDRELLSISDRSGNSGVLLVSLNNSLYILPYELKIGITSSITGRSQSIICDFCRTWQYGDRSASIRFVKSKNTSVSYLCCADLKCSMHVRDKTDAASTSRAQLREDLSIDQRVERFNTRLANLIGTLPINPIEIS